MSRTYVPWSEYIVGSQEGSICAEGRELLRAAQKLEAAGMTPLEVYRAAQKETKLSRLMMEHLGDGDQVPVQLKAFIERVESYSKAVVIPLEIRTSATALLVQMRAATQKMMEGLKPRPYHHPAIGYRVEWTPIKKKKK